MSEFEHSYRTGRSVLGLVVLVGWIVALLGVVVLGAGGFAVLRSATPLQAVAPLAAMAAGAGAMLVGFIGVASAQHMRATFDIADMTREMLTLARRRPATPARPPAPPAAADPEAAPPMPPRLRARQEEGDASPPTFSAPTRPAVARAKGGDGKVHPIFSAKPPR